MLCGELAFYEECRAWSGTSRSTRTALRFEDDGTVTATEKNPFLQQSGQGTWTREGAFVMNYPEEVFTGTVATGGQVAPRRSLPKERRERSTTARSGRSTRRSRPLEIQAPPAAAL